jgi:hypothetical protein
VVCRSRASGERSTLDQEVEPLDIGIAAKKRVVEIEQDQVHALQVPLEAAPILLAAGS